jgi:hypothetical protein
LERYAATTPCICCVRFLQDIAGVWTVHASSAVDALVQLQVLAQMASTTMQPQVVAALVSRAVDVVIYQQFFEDEGVRRVAEVVEIDRPGVRYDGGAIQYCVRVLVQWDEYLGRWMFPELPSDRLRRSLSRVGCDWPEEGLRDVA